MKSKIADNGALPYDKYMKEKYVVLGELIIRDLTEAEI